MNCESWDVAKKSLSETVKGFAFIKSCGIADSTSSVVIFSFIALSILYTPILAWFSTSSPTDRTLLLARWSISSTSSLPSLKSNIFFMIAIMSSFLKMVILSEQFKFSLEFILTLPTSDKSYLSELKNKLLKIWVAISIVGGSPGLKTLYISVIASFLLLFLSLNKVCNKYGPLFIEFVEEINMELILFSRIFLIIVSFSSVPILKVSSPQTISLWRNFPYKDWSETKISFKPPSYSFLAFKKFVFSPALITVFPDLASIISSEKFLDL